MSIRSVVHNCAKVLPGALTLAMIAGCGEQPQHRNSEVVPVSAAPETIPSRGTLKPGETLPALDGGGWINGPPPKFDGRQNRLVVVDVWGQWCSEVPRSLPKLVALHRKYAPRGVAFVSLTTDSRQVAQRFVHDYRVPWPSGFGADRREIASLGAANDNVPVPGYDVKPTLYVVDGAGRVLWCDEHVRMDHYDRSKRKLISEIESVLVKHL